MGSDRLTNSPEIREKLAQLTLFPTIFFSDWTQTGEIPRLGLYDTQAQDFDKILDQTESRHYAINLHPQDIGEFCKSDGDDSPSAIASLHALI